MRMRNWCARDLALLPFQWFSRCLFLWFCGSPVLQLALSACAQVLQHDHNSTIHYSRETMAESDETLNVAGYSVYSVQSTQQWCQKKSSPPRNIQSSVKYRGEHQR